MIIGTIVSNDAVIISDPNGYIILDSYDTYLIRVCTGPSWRLTVRLMLFVCLFFFSQWWRSIETTMTHHHIRFPSGHWAPASLVAPYTVTIRQVLGTSTRQACTMVNGLVLVISDSRPCTGVHGRALIISTSQLGIVIINFVHGR